MTRRHLRATSVVLALSMTVGSKATYAQQAPTAVNLTATSANVAEPGNPLKIRLMRWSTDEERVPVVSALNPVPALPPAAAAAGPPADASPGASAAAGDRGGAARGRGGRGGRGARGGRGEATAPLDPIAALTAAIGKAPTLGYIWTNDVTGYSIKYAYRASLPDGGERIILATDRRLGAYAPAWTPVAPSPVDYEFSLIEIRLDGKGVGEGKTSLTTKVVVDNEARTVALENYAATPAILRNVRR
jgi:hypothetical protein